MSRGRRCGRRWFGGLLGVLGVALAASLLLRAERSVREDTANDRPVQRLEDGYVSSSACRACHPRPYASWHASWHRRMTQVAGPETVVGDFDDVEVKAWGQRFQLTREGNDRFAEWAGVRRRVLVTTGSHHQQDYWVETGQTRKLGFLPLMWLVDEQRWIPFSAAFLMPPTAEMPTPVQLDRWQTTCIKCHTTHGKPRTRLPHDDRDMDTSVAEFGIACEACHGPGAEHVRSHRQPFGRWWRYRTPGADPTIVNPARLDAGPASEVCGQCHSIHRPREPQPRHARQPDDWRDHGLPFRPGGSIEPDRYLVRASRAGEERFEQIRTFDPTLLEDRFWPDGMVRVSGREYNGLLESPCFVHGRGERRLECRSCHEMHPPGDDPRPLAAWADDQLAAGMDGDAACLACHPRFQDAAARGDHTHHDDASSGARCMNCHMPYTTWGLLKAMRSHTISSPTVIESRDAGRPNACNACHLDRSVAWTGKHLERWYGQAPVAVPPVLAAVPLSVVWALSGDAGQRALVAWAMGWQPALEVSRAAHGEWIAPVLARLLLDPYDAVRFAAAKALARQPGHEDFEVDFMGSEAERTRAIDDSLARWSEVRRAQGQDTRLDFLLDDPDGRLPQPIFQLLTRARNDRRVSLAE